MALFAPTNITPDVRGAIGNGVVDLSEGFPVSWQINGNSATPMTGYTISVYSNDALSTLLFSKSASGLSFYGTDALGKPVLYSVDIPASEYSGKLTNGREYKLVVSVAWDDSGVTVSQQSASVFLTRQAPTLTIGSIPQPVENVRQTFSAEYWQAQGDPLAWVRWRIGRFENGSLGEVLYDSGNLYGVGRLQTTYDGFFSGQTYAVRCTGQTVNGADADSDWTSFSVSYSTTDMLGSVQATCVNGGSGVQLDIPLPVSIPAETSESGVSLDPDKGTVNLTGAGEVSWSKVGSSAMQFAAPWSAVWYANAVPPVDAASDPTDQTLVSFKMGANSFDVVYEPAYGTDPGTVRVVWVTESGGTITLADVKQLAPSATQSNPVWVYLTQDSVMMAARAIRPTKRPGSAYTVVRAEFSAAAYPQSPLSEVRLGASQTCSYLQIFDDSGQTAIKSWLAAGESLQSYSAARDGATLFMTTWHLFTGNFNAGTAAALGNFGVVQMTVYRTDESDQARLRKIAETEAFLTSSLVRVTDYSAHNREAAKYYVYFSAGSDYFLGPITSETITPCHWDWVLLSCSEIGENAYSVEAEYRFGKNFSSGAISNNNVPSVLQNFTRYPTVQAAPQNYQSGSLTSLIGVIADGEYTDTIAARDAIWALSTASNTLFLKNRKGDVLMVAISGAITMQTGDNTPQQTQTATIPWVEIGSTDGVQIYSLS